MRVYLQKVLSLVVCGTLTCLPLLGQDNDRKVIQNSLYLGISDKVNVANRTPIPLTVLRSLVYGTLQTDVTWQDLHASAAHHTPYKALDASEAFINDLQGQLSQARKVIIAQSFQGFSTSTTFQMDPSLVPRDSSLISLQQQLQSVAANELPSLRTLQSKVVPLQAAAVKLVLANLGDAGTASAVLRNATDATKEIKRLIDKPTLSDLDLKTLSAQGSLILNTLLNDQAKEALGQLPTAQSEIKAYYDKLTAISAVITSPTPLKKGLSVPRLPSLTPKMSLQLLESLGEIHEAHTTLSQTLNLQGQELADGLTVGVGALTKNWDTLADAAQKVSPEMITHNQLPEQVRNLVPFMRDFGDLNDVLTGKMAVDVPTLSKSLSAVGILPRGTALADASSALTQIMAAKGDYTAAATGLISSLTELNSHGVTIPGIQQLAPVLTTANSILKAAGPIATIAGFASGLSAFGAIGGLGGLGGSGDDAIGAALQQINEKLDKINSKLDTVISKLDALSDQMAKDHAQVMNALEAIEFDVARTYYLMTNEMHNRVRNPCVRSTDSTEQYLSEQLKSCDDALANIYIADLLRNGPPAELTFETNLRSYNLNRNALTQFTDEVTYRQNLTNLLSNTDCQGLSYPSADLEGLQYKIEEYGRRTDSRNCSTLIASNLIEPGILTQYVNWEQNAFAATPRLGRAEAIAWWQAAGPHIRERWTSKELPLLNLAIAQQAAVSGDVLIGELSALLDKSLKDDGQRAELAKVWKENGVLSENITRYWIWSKMRSQSSVLAAQQGPEWLRTLYAFAWEAGDDEYWYLLTGASPKEVRFTRVPMKRTGADGKEVTEMVWNVAFRDLAAVQMANPTEMNLLELRWPSVLVQVVNARNTVLDALGGMALVENSFADASHKDLKNILEAFLVSSPEKH